LPSIEKRQQTNFEQFRLSSSNNNLGAKTLREYKQELESIEKARFKALPLDKAVLEGLYRARTSRSTESKK